MASIEEKVEEHFKALLDDLEIRHFGKTEEINSSITKALKEADSKSGGSGVNYPDIQLLLQNKTRRDIPVMIEAKGTKGKLEKLTPGGDIELVSGGKNPNRAVQQFAVNGALHYGLAILDEGTYGEVIIVGINGSMLEEGRVKDPEVKAYYVSKKNDRVPKELVDFDFVQMKQPNIDTFFVELDKLSLTDAEKEKLKRDKEELLEQSIKGIHQRIYDDASIKTLLGTNEKLYLFCGLIMAGLTTEGVKPLEVADFYSNDDHDDNDGSIVLRRTKAFLRKKNCSTDKVNMVLNYLKPVFEKRDLWKPVNGESVIKSIYKQVKEDILPLLESNIHLDFTGKILNSLNDWVAIENDKLNDVVLTPRFVTMLMARITRTDMDSFVWDTCMGSSGFLVSAMEIMIDDAKKRIKDTQTLDSKVENIKHNQLLGIEILGNIYILAVLNMILMGDVYAKRILEKNTLIASIHMPGDLFNGKSSVQTAIYLFQVNRPHEADDVVTFIDFSEDGYTRQNRKKSTQKVNLRNTDHALERYDEVAAICLGKKPKTSYYTEANGLVIRDTVSLDGNDWTFNQHKRIDTTPTEADFKKTVADYLAWKVGAILKGEVMADV